MKRILNKRGMTYVELLVAFTLLMLIIVSFTPMLLKSYEAVYSAGEKSAGLYAARTKLEDGLATRRSADTENVTLNFDSYISETRIVGRRIPATTEAMLETLFYGAHSTLEIISPKHVPDDGTTYQVILQATNIPVTFDSVNGKTKTDVENAAKNKDKDDNNVVALVAKAPGKKTTSGADTTSDEAAYDTNGFQLNMTVDDVDAARGKIYITLRAPSGKTLDFTTSPIRIQAWYINERSIMKTVSDYLYIDPMTILIGCETETGGADYFTTAGVTKSLTNTTSGTTVTTSFNVEGREMPLKNANSAYAVSPKANHVSFTTATWVDNDTENELGPYYVMTGTNGYIYRMYNFTHYGSLYKATASQTQTNSLKATTDGYMSIKTGAVVYPSFWSGDYTDWFSFQTVKDANTYGLDYGDNRNSGGDNNFDCSFLTIYNSVDGNPNTASYSNRAHYSMVFSGYKTNYKYLSARGRRLSYILAEHGSASYRMGAKLDKDSDYKGFNSRWESSNYFGDGDKTDFNPFNGWIVRYTENTKPVYMYSGTGSTSDVFDYHLAPLYLKSFTSIPPTALETASISKFKGAFWCPFQYDTQGKDDGDIKYSNDTGQNKSEDTVRSGVRSGNTINANGDPVGQTYDGIADWVQSKKYATNVNLTSVAYIPVSTGSDSSSGQLVYFGTVPSYGLIMQHDAKSGTAYDSPNKVWNGEDRNGNQPATAYYVDGSAATGTDIYRFSGNPSNIQVEREPIPAQYARWIPEQKATWIPPVWIEAQWAIAPDFIHVKFRYKRTVSAALNVYTASWQINGTWYDNNAGMQKLNELGYMYSTGSDQWTAYWYSPAAYAQYTLANAGNLPSYTNKFQARKHDADYTHPNRDYVDYWPGWPTYKQYNKGQWIPEQDVYLKKDGTGTVAAGTNCWKDGDDTGHWSTTNCDSNGVINGTACWGYNNVPTSVRTDVPASQGGTDHQGGKPGDPDALNLMPNTGPGWYYDENGNPSQDRYTTTDKGGADSQPVQYQIKNILGAKAGADTSRDGNNNLFYNTFRDTKTYVYHDTDLEYTFGYCSNWLIGAGTVVIQSKTELTTETTGSDSVAKSFEKFYVRSYPSASQGNSTATNNLFYDTWFPGEYYNLTQTASLDGVTVACGYTVAGAAFESAYNDGETRYATALGGIYNDGVLSIYETRPSSNPIETGTGNYVNGGFRNLLYYKSPTFQNSTTHNRQSVRFTAVDLMSELNTGSKQLEYYAWYGDNHGNVYRSRVAYTSGSVTLVEDDEGNATITNPENAQLNLATNITYDNTVTGMQSIRVGGTDAFNGGNPLSTNTFTEIEKITCSPNMVVITGKCSGNTAKVVVLYRERTGTDSSGQETYSEWKTKVVSLGTGHINDAVVLGDYYYAVGTTTATSSVGKIWAVKVSALINDGSDSDSTLPNMITRINRQVWNATTKQYEDGGPLPKLTCIAGRITGVNLADDASA